MNKIIVDILAKFISIGIPLASFYYFFTRHIAFKTFKDKEFAENNSIKRFEELSEILDKRIYKLEVKLFYIEEYLTQLKKEKNDRKSRSMRNKNTRAKKKD